MANPLIEGVLDNNVWYVDFGTSNHVINHKEWFKDISDLKKLGFVVVMTLHIPSHKVARCHCPCKMSQQNI